MKPTKKAAEMTVKELAAYIDQSVLKPEFTEEDVRKYIQELSLIHISRSAPESAG